MMQNDADLERSRPDFRHRFRGGYGGGEHCDTCGKHWSQHSAAQFHLGPRQFEVLEFLMMHPHNAIAVGPLGSVYLIDVRREHEQVPWRLYSTLDDYGAFTQVRSSDSLTRRYVISERGRALLTANMRRQRRKAK